MFLNINFLKNLLDVFIILNAFMTNNKLVIYIMLLQKQQYALLYIFLVTFKFSSIYMLFYIFLITFKFSSISI